ncbi:hypothetical protein F5Y13DRAFT_168241 [Hypoxylon sp. FL1857]|nr:hypothetical protein F5Y13DRAFT_168241 [Hypoxylon sp. FL1857]
MLYSSSIASYSGSGAPYPSNTTNTVSSSYVATLPTTSSASTSTPSESSSTSIQISSSATASTDSSSSILSLSLTVSIGTSSLSGIISSTSSIDASSSTRSTPSATASSTSSTATLSATTTSYSSTLTDSTSATISTFTSSSTDSVTSTASSVMSSSTESTMNSAPTPTPTFYLRASGVLKGTGSQKNYLPRSNNQYAQLYSSGNAVNSKILTFAVSSPVPPATTFYIDDQSHLVNAADGYIMNTYETATSNQLYWDADPTGGGWAPPTCQVNADFTLSCAIGKMNQFSICFGSSGTNLGSNGLLYLTASAPDQGSNCRGVTANVVYA